MILNLNYLKEKADYSITSNESVITSEFETGNVTTNPIYDNNGSTNIKLKNKIMGKLNVKNIRTPSLINSKFNILIINELLTNLNNISRYSRS